MRWNEDRAAAAVSSPSAPDTDYRCYSDLLRAAVIQLSNDVLGDSLDSGFRPPKPYTGKYCEIFLSVTVIVITAVCLMCPVCLVCLVT